MDVDAPANPLTTIADVVTQQPEQVKTEPDPKVEGVIGHLEVYRSGVVKMRLGNGIVLDVREPYLNTFYSAADSFTSTENRSRQRRSLRSCNMQSI
jgi:DNA-directed RNA polymerase III subunit RPC4